MPLRRKLFLLGLIAIVTVEIVGAVTAVRARDAVRDEVRRGLQTVADLQAELISNQITLSAQQILQFTGSPAGERVAAQIAGGPTRLAPEATRTLLEPALGGNILSLALVTPNGFFVADTAAIGRPVLGLERLDLARFTARALRDADGAVGEARLDGAAGRYDQLVPDRFPDPRYLLLAQVSLGPITDVVRTRTDLRPATSAYLVQRSDDVVDYLTGPGGDDAATPPALPVTRVDDPAVRAALGRRTVVETDGRAAVVAATRAVPDTSWGVVTQADRGEAFGGADRLVWAQLLGFVFGGVALAVGTWLLTRSLLARIERLTAGAEAVSQGNLEARIGDRGSDELGVLARAFDRMADTIAEDVQRRSQVESRLDHQARHDPLTGLPNRVELERSMRSLSASCRSGSTARAALLFCDLDDFKRVNDELGHAIGDELLCTIAARFRGVLGPDDVLARFGGDEFVVLCPSLDTPEMADRLAERLTSALANPIVLAGREIVAAVSIGIAPFDPSTNAAQVLKDADAAMYRAKQRNRRRAQRTPGSSSPPTRQDELAAWHQALERDEFTLLYQPIRHLRDRRIVALEALVRRRRGDELRLPAEFLPQLDRLHLTPALDRWVLRRATEQFAAWRHAGLGDDVRLVVNAAPGTFDDDLAVGGALDTLSRAGLRPDHLIIDIAAGAVDRAAGRQSAALARLASTGVQVAIDDFGRPGAGVAELRTTVARHLKLDRTLTSEVDRDRRARATARSLVVLAADLGLVVTAEGVERPEQAEVLAEVGCTLAQGFALGLPSWPSDLGAELGLAAVRPAADTSDVH